LALKEKSDFKDVTFDLIIAPEKIIQVMGCYVITDGGFTKDPSLICPFSVKFIGVSG
jgi:hypothetical protein